VKDKEVEEKRFIIRRHWDEFQDHLTALASRYNTYYTTLKLQKADESEE
jgi:hypothetical protein